MYVANVTSWRLEFVKLGHTEILFTVEIGKSAFRNSIVSEAYIENNLTGYPCIDHKRILAYMCYVLT